MRARAVARLAVQLVGTELTTFMKQARFQLSAIIAFSFLLERS